LRFKVLQGSALADPVFDQVFPADVHSLLKRRCPYKLGFYKPCEIAKFTGIQI